MKTYIVKKIGEISNGLKVETILRNEKGLPVYGCLCTSCGARGVPVHHAKWEIARCVSSLHGRDNYKPVSLREIRAEEAAEQRKQRDAEDAKLREAEASLTSTHRKLADLAKKEIAAGRPDPEFVVPQSVSKLKMSLEKARSFVEASCKQFMDETPEAHKYFPDQKNWDCISSYVWNCGVQIATVEVWKQAFDRLVFLGLISEVKKPAPAPVDQPEPVEPEAQSDLVDGWDENGLPCKFTPRQVFLMSSEQYRSAFRLCERSDGTDFSPKVRRSLYQ
jgi:hypothetical protein